MQIRWDIKEDLKGNTFVNFHSYRDLKYLIERWKADWKWWFSLVLEWNYFKLASKNQNFSNPKPLKFKTVNTNYFDEFDNLI